VHDSEFLPPGYIVRSRRDRDDGYSRVIIMKRSSIPCAELYKSQQTAIGSDHKKGNKHSECIASNTKSPTSYLI
jgi:hypothetical protein